MLDLPEEIARTCAPLFEALPWEEAMLRLQGSHPKHTARVEEVNREAVISSRPELIAGLWLYVDNLDRSHTVAQGIDGPTGAWWHGIMHRREGDFSNSHYWMRQVAGHPLLNLRPDLDPHDLVDAVSRGAGDDSALVARQKEEWRALFEWCASNS